MVVTYVMVAVTIIGVLGGVATVLSYDHLDRKSSSRMRIPKHSRRSARRSRPSRQLRAVESALAEDAATDQPPDSSTVRSHGHSAVRSHGRWRRR
jgi:hypothetical protein